ncbi:cytochrome P450 [Actinosynnema sp. CS-041913]|uniref:cytochrome P450 n=1 Tax=Actinosynnema sp. CS-041913 TaxID=3239917 RepID=UPI003D91A3E2
MRRFRRDPLGFVEDVARLNPAGVARLPWGAWCVSDTRLARVLLRDPRFNAGMSGFFGNALPSRPAQSALGHHVRDMMRSRMPEYRTAVAAAAERFPAVSRWPAAGVDLVYRCTADLLLHPDAPPDLRRLQQQRVRGGLGRQQTFWRRARAELRRRRLVSALVEHVAERRKQSRAAQPRDLLDAVIGACPDEVTDRAVTSVYLLLFRSIVGVVGHSVAWSVLSAGLHHPPGSAWPWPVDWLVREAARHRPVVWMVARRIPEPVDFGGIAFPSGTRLSVSPYLLHHDERHWTRPGVFRPERWAEPGGRGFYLPYSSGPFVCAGAAVAHTLVTEAVAALGAEARLTVVDGDLTPVVTDSNVPRPFTLHRTSRTPTHRRR